MVNGAWSIFGAACEKVMDAYFGPDGIEYTVGRIPMDSCDFSVEQYSFADVPGDYNLSYFDTDVEKDAEQRVRARGHLALAATAIRVRGFCLYSVFRKNTKII